MNLSKKALALALLSVIAAPTYARNKKSCKPCDDKKCSPFDLSLPRKFGANLSFSQELTQVEENLVARETTEPFASNPDRIPNVCGRIELCFSRDLSSVDYKLFIINATGDSNSNEKVTQAHLHAGRASQNGPIIAFLLGEEGDGFTCADSNPENGLAAKGTLTNADLVNPPVMSPDGNVYNSIAAVFDGVRRGDVYVNVHGVGPVSVACPNPEDFPTFEDGLIRGQIFSDETTG